MTGNRSTSGNVRIGVTAALLAVLPLTWRAVDEGRLWRVYRGDVRIICPLTVGGSFEIRTTSIVGSFARRSSSQSAYAGDFGVDLRTLDSGIALRNDHLRHKYLEVERGEGFERAIVSDVDVSDVDPRAPRPSSMGWH